MVLSIQATTISDAWFQLVHQIQERGYEQYIESGSFEGHTRTQLAAVAIWIRYPDVDMVPEIPPGISVDPPTTLQYIEDYFAGYLMSPKLSVNETYTYGSRIMTPMPKGGTQVERVMEMLKKTPQTNQAIIEIGTPIDLDICYGKDGKLDPPCLRLLDFKVVKHILTVTCYFRSWDLWAGFPTNLGGIEKLKQAVAEYAGLKSGPMIAYSAGLHIYDYQIDWVNKRLRN